MTRYDAILIAAVAILVLLPARLDPAIRIKEWQLRGRRRAQPGEDA